MDAEICVVVAMAILDENVVTDLKANSISVVVAGLDVADGIAVTVLEKDAASVVSVQFVVVFAVAVKDEVLNHHV